MDIVDDIETDSCFIGSAGQDTTDLLSINDALFCSAVHEDTCEVVDMVSEVHHITG